MTGLRIPVANHRVRTVHTAPSWLIGMWVVVGIVNAVRVADQAVDGDWSSALRSAVFAAMCWLLASRHRDVNALMGGHQ